MFSRLIYDEWVFYVPIVAFMLSFLVFVYIVLRSVTMKKNQVDYMSHLPLEDDNPKPSTHEQSA